jgi:hypothetical protein
MGNQLFQYAASKRLAERYNTDLKLDLSYYGKQLGENRVDQDSSKETIFFHLSKFSITADEATPADIDEVLRFGRYGKYLADRIISKRLNKLLLKARMNYQISSSFLNYYNEKSTQYGRYNPELLGVGPNAYIDGYWETPKYFEDIRAILEREFELQTELSAKSQNIARRIQETKSVGLHVRRGDLVKSGNDLPIEYFEEAIRFVADTNTTYFVFSVDMDWVKNHVKIDAPVVYVDHHHPNNGNRTNKAHEYFELLKLCEDTIISNSTFSWWAAWLGQEEESTVVCPYIWRPQDPPSGMKYVRNLDLIPNSWDVIKWS